MHCFQYWFQQLPKIISDTQFTRKDFPIQRTLRYRGHLDNGFFDLNVLRTCCSLRVSSCRGVAQPRACSLACVLLGGVLLVPQPAPLSAPVAPLVHADVGTILWVCCMCILCMHMRESSRVPCLRPPACCQLGAQATCCSPVLFASAATYSYFFLFLFLLILLQLRLMLLPTIITNLVSFYLQSCKLNSTFITLSQIPVVGGCYPNQISKSYEISILNKKDKKAVNTKIIQRNNMVRLTKFDLCLYKQHKKCFI